MTGRNLPDHASPRHASVNGGPEPDLCRAELRTSWREDPGISVLLLLVLGIVNVLWFNVFNFHTIMGDDVYAWARFAAHPSFHDLFATASGGKYRPVTTAAQYVLFRVFSSDYQAWVAFNVSLNFVIVCLLFALVRRVARGDNMIAFAAALLYITSRFSYYNILQLMGVMEALCILFLVLILYVTVDFTESDAWWPGLALASLFLAITLTHERYVALFPFLALLVVFRAGMSWNRKFILLALFSVPPLLNVALKRFVFGTTVLMGTGGQAISFGPSAIVKFMAAGLVNMFWVNSGPDYLSGISVSEAGTKARLLVWMIAVSLAAVIVLAIVRVLRLKDRCERRSEAMRFVLWAVLFLSLLLAASITIRQEYRWLYAPFVVCLVYFCYQFARLPWRSVAKYTVLVLLCVLLVTADSYYKRHEGNVFFFYGEAIADSTYDATMGRYGQSMGERTMYVQKRPDMQWILGGTLFLVPYLGLDHQKIVWVDDLRSIPVRSLDPKNSMFFRVDPATGVLVDVTREFVGR